MLTIESVSKKIGSQTILKDVSAVFEGGKTYCLLGKNGAGKSTTLKILAGAVSPDSGAVYLDGMNLFQDGSKPRFHLGYFPETPELYNFLSVREFLDFVSAVKRVDAAAYLDILKDLHMADRLDEKIERLSNGMKRKVTLAACLMNWPAHLVLDEPTNALDKPSRDFLKEVIVSYRKKGRVVVFSTHQMDFALELTDTFLKVEAGNLGQTRPE